MHDEISQRVMPIRFVICLVKRLAYENNVSVNVNPILDRNMVRVTVFESAEVGKKQSCVGAGLYYSFEIAYGASTMAVIEMLEPMLVEARAKAIKPIRSCLKKVKRS